MITVILHNIVYDERLSIEGTAGGDIAVTVSGHAITGAAGPMKGENLVCAAVSTLAQNLLRSITIIADIRPEYRVGDGFMELRIRTGDLDGEKRKTVSALLESFLIGMLDVKRQNPDFISIRTEIENNRDT